MWRCQDAVQTQCTVYDVGGREGIRNQKIAAFKNTSAPFTPNEVPTKPLDIIIFGEGAGGELGLGSKEVDGLSPIEAMNPRSHPLLSAKDVGVVQVACGGNHGIAITRDNQILTWGLNDYGALGRNTNVEEAKDDMLNPSESTPKAIDTSNLDPDIKWVQVVGSECASFALTTDGRVFGWGTFRGKDGIIGFTYISKNHPDNQYIQKTPRHIPELKGIKQLAAGKNHVLALDQNGKVYSWGCGENGQLGRRTSSRYPSHALRPERVRGFKGKVYKVVCGAHHSFALSKIIRMYCPKYLREIRYYYWRAAFAWGLNNYGQLGSPDAIVGAGAIQPTPVRIPGLLRYDIFDIAGGEHHSLAVTRKGQLLTWGRVDSFQTGFRTHVFTKKNVIFDKNEKPRILLVPTIMPEMPHITSVNAGPDHCFAITTKGGKVYSWGSSYNGRTGHDNEDDTEIPTLVNYITLHEKKVVFAGAGGSFSILASIAKDAREEEN
ncbi:RCC1/BLIP-II [Hypoxylon sp. FL1150]|nr:RCC1/BLIP-II [Hypoxylon sp. FL1150]